MTAYEPTAGPSKESAFLDANVIRGQLTNDILLSLAEQDVFDPRWSEQVLDEMRRNRPAGVSEQRIDRRIAAMNAYFPRAMTRGHEGLIPRMRADPKDQHVLAAAVHSRSQVLVTDNLKDFDPPSTGLDAIRVENLSAFLTRKLQDRPELVVPALQGMVDRNRRDPQTMAALLDKMAAMPELRGFAAVLGERTGGVDGDVRKQAEVAFDGLSAPGRGEGGTRGAGQPAKGQGQGQETDRGPER